MWQEKAPAMGLLKGMSAELVLEPFSSHNILCFFLEKTKFL
jgi:hypothetical protein